MTDTDYVQTNTLTAYELVPEGAHDGIIESVEGGVTSKGTPFVRGGIRLCRGELLYVFLAGYNPAARFILAVKKRLIGCPVRVMVRHRAALGKVVYEAQIAEEA